MPSNWNKCCKRQHKFLITAICALPLYCDSKRGLQRFRELLSNTVTELNFGDDAMKKKAERVGNMAPMIIGVTFTPNREVAKPKPEWEQMLTAGCAAYALQLAASAQGFDNVWITGMWVNSPLLREAFECADKDKIIGLMMIGSPTEEGGDPKIPTWNVLQLIGKA